MISNMDDNHNATRSNKLSSSVAPEDVSGGQLGAIDDNRERDNDQESDTNSEDDSLQRMSEQAQRRRVRDSHFSYTREEDDNADGDDETIDPTDFLRRLLQNRSGPRDNSDRYGENGDIEDDSMPSGDPRSGFLRAFSSLMSGRNDTDRGQGFADVVQRFMGGFGGRGSHEMEGYINNLNQREDTFLILETLNELSERLLMMNGITAERVIPANKLARSLVQIMLDPILANELELHLVACRCLYNFLEVNQDFIHDALNNNVVVVLCEKLLEISFIDLTEQALQTLEMISRDPISHNQIVANDGLKACLQYLDFLTIHAQRKCMTIVANASANIRDPLFQKVADVFDTLTNFIKHHDDSVVVENGWLAVSRIIMSFRLRPDLLEVLFSGKESFLKDLTDIIYISSNRNQSSNESSKTSLSFGTCISLIKSLIVLISVSVEISKVLLTQCSIGEIIVKSLIKYSKASSNGSPLEPIDSEQNSGNISIERLMAASKELLSQLLSLTGYLLPISYSEEDALFLQSGRDGNDEKKPIDEERVRLYTEVVGDAYWKFVNDVWFLLINSFQASMDYEIRRKVLINLFRIVSFSDKSNIKRIHGVELISVLLASVVNQGKSTFSQANPSKDDVDMLDSEVDDELNTHDNSGTSDNESEEYSSVNENAGDNLWEIGDDRNDDNDNNESFEDGESFNDEEHDDDIEDEGDADDDEDAGEAGDDGILETELDNDDELRELNVPSDVEDTIGRPSCSQRAFDDSASLTSSKLLLLTLLISKTLLCKAPHLFIHAFEREGLISDTSAILSRILPSSKSEEPVKYFSSYLPAGYIDSEVTRDVFSKYSNGKLHSEIEKVGSKIENFYIDLKETDRLGSIPEHMKILDRVKNVLSDPKKYSVYNFAEWRDLWDMLKLALVGPISQDSPSSFHVSSFELIATGVIELLARVLLNSDESDYFHGFSDCYKAFVRSFFVEGAADPPISLFVKKLQEALTRSESFEIISSGAPVSYQRFQRDQGHTAAMAGQVKLKLISSDHDSLPPAMQNMVLSVHAIATFLSLEAFFKQRLLLLDGWGNHMSFDGAEEKAEVPAPNSNAMEFSINDEIIPNETTIYGAIYRSIQGNEGKVVDTSQIWSRTHIIKFKKVNKEPTHESNFFTSPSNVRDGGSDIYDKTTSSILNLLKILFDMNTYMKSKLPLGGISVPDSIFMNWKLTVKLSRQLEEPLVVASGTLPSWSIHITRNYSFLFPLETRIVFLQYTSFGYSRLIHQWQLRANQESEDSNQSSGNGTSNGRLQLGHPTRHKVRLSRKLMLQSALKVLSMYGSTPGVLEIEYFDEVGSGLGPTLEFYATVSKEFARKKLRLWRDYDTSDDSEGFIQSSTGLFPGPLDKAQLASDNGKKVLYFFNALGKFTARGLLDSRIIDFNFNLVFLTLVQHLNKVGRSKSHTRDNKRFANISYLRLVDSRLADSLNHLLKYAKAAENVEPKERSNIKFDGATLEDLSLSFVLPGHSDYQLIPNGENTAVTIENVEEFVNKVLDATLYSGIIHQTKAFMDGFSKVFPINSLIIFSPEELIKLLGNSEEDWSLSTVTAAINANHGYSKDSDAIKSLVRILTKLSESERGAFLQFLTGAPKLPIGGFKSLAPEITVVRRHPEDGLTDDDYLPSVMTCANYLKLPNYSSENIMKERLLQAIHDGAGAFLLS